jgi:hypothetical protein
MSNLFEIALVIYFLVGTLLATIGPASKDITVEVDRIRGSSLLDAYLEREPPTKLKLWVFRAFITAAFILLWPVFIFGIMKAQRKAREETEAFEDERAQGLWFQYLGGYGSISCNDCMHTESITSFTHGRDSSTAGFQCQACGKFAAIRSGGPGKATDYQSSLICECSGKFEREKVLFCPECQSKNLSYDMKFIT